MDNYANNEKVIDLRRQAAEYFQKAAWNQMMSLENYRKNNLSAADRFAQLSFDAQMYAVECAELADAELALNDFLELEE